MGLPWFAHESKANRDTKMRKLLLKYGAEGYGLYWYCVEHIADNVGPKLTFELEHDSEILAHELKIDTLLVEEIMRYMVSVGLFEESEGVVSCLSLLKHLTPKCTRNEQLKTLIREANSIPLSATVPDSPRLSEIVPPRGEERRRDKEPSERSDSAAEQFELFWAKYPRKDGKKKALDHFRQLNRANRAACLADDVVRRFKGRERNYIPAGDQYVKRQLWQDELPATKGTVIDMRGALDD